MDIKRVIYSTVCSLAHKLRGVALFYVFVGLLCSNAAPQERPLQKAVTVLRSVTKGSNEIELVVQVFHREFRLADTVEGEVSIRNISGKPLKIFLPGLRARVDYPFPEEVQQIVARPYTRSRTDTVILGSNESYGRSFSFRLRATDCKVVAGYFDNPKSTNFVLIAETPALRVVP